MQLLAVYIFYDLWLIKKIKILWSVGTVFGLLNATWGKQSIASGTSPFQSEESSKFMFSLQFSIKVSTFKCKLSLILSQLHVMTNWNLFLPFFSGDAICPAWCIINWRKSAYLLEFHSPKKIYCYCILKWKNCWCQWEGNLSRKLEILSCFSFACFIIYLGHASSPFSVCTLLYI